MGLGSLVKNVFKGLGKIAESKLGKLAITAGAIWVGYGIATQGMAFFGGASTAAGAAGATGGTAAGATTEGLAGLATAAPVGTGTVLAPAATTTAVAPSAASIAPVGTGTVLAPTAAPAVAGQGAISSALNAAPEALTTTTEPGFMSKVGGFIEKNPMASYGMMNLGGGMISSALAPNPVDEHIRLEAARQSQNRIAGYGGGSGGEPVRIGNRTYM